MDEKPFLEVNMLDLNDGVVNELKKLTRPAFNVERLINTAGELKYMREIKKLLAEQMENPADEFVKFCASRVFNGSPAVCQKCANGFARGLKYVLREGGYEGRSAPRRTRSD